ncbi:MAG: Sortase domain, partial [Actinomycetota bacterium]
DDDTAYKIVPPSEISVIGRLGFDAVTLTTCTPIGSDAERLIVHAKLLRSVAFSRK